MGLLDAPATIIVSKEGAQDADTIIWENVTAMWARLAPGSHENAYWLAHPTCLPQLLSLSLAIGTGGAVPRGALEPDGKGGYMLLGRPLIVTSRVSAIGDVGDLILVDPTQIAVGIRRQITVDRSPFPYFTSDALALRGTFRGDVKPLWEKVQTLRNGTSTVSPVVTLEAR